MFKFKLENIIYTYIFICIIILGTFVIIFNVDIKNYNIIVILTFIVNGIIILIELSKSSELGYSLKEIFCLFMFIFMFISPLVQYLYSKFPWWNTDLITSEIVAYANFMIMIFMLLYLCTYKLTMDILKYKRIKYKSSINIKRSMNLFFIATVLCSSFIILKTGFSNLFSRATNIPRVESSTFSLIVSNTFRAVPVLYVALNLLYIKKNNIIYKKTQFIIGALLMILVNFPTATARFWMASVYLGLLLIIKRKFKNPHLFKTIIIIGILIIFPAINIFRYNNFLDAIKQGLYIPNPSDAFLVGDFDSYSMLARTISYVDTYGISWGHQLLGNILFFIPRKIWPTKPIGSGAMIATQMGWSFTNVSCPFIGEGYINFGIIGVVLFAIILGRLTALFDKNYNEYCFTKEKITYIELVYPFSIGFLFFILRGDLLSSLSYFIGFITPIILIWLFNYEKNK